MIMQQFQGVPGPSQEEFNELADHLAQSVTYGTKTIEKSFSGTTYDSYDLVLTNNSLVSVQAYRGGNLNIYANESDSTNRGSILSVTAPSTLTQFAIGNSAYLKAGTYKVYYIGSSSESNGNVVTWS